MLKLAVCDDRANQLALICALAKAYFSAHLLTVYITEGKGTEGQRSLARMFEELGMPISIICSHRKRRGEHERL